LFQHGVDFKSDAAAQRGINPLGEVMRAASLQLFHRSAHFVLGLRFRQWAAVAADHHRRILYLIAGEGFGIEKRGGF
jgi:chorismate-pyruvate lyase